VKFNKTEGLEPISKPSPLKVRDLW